VLELGESLREPPRTLIRIAIPNVPAIDSDRLDQAYPYFILVEERRLIATGIAESAMIGLCKFNSYAEAAEKTEAHLLDE
jgi:hypothetical protein